MKHRVMLGMLMQVLFLCFLAAIPSRAQVANNTSLVGSDRRERGGNGIQDCFGFSGGGGIGTQISEWEVRGR